MEGLAAGASVIAVVSIALQLADSIKRFSEFIGSIQEAPEEIESFLSDLQILSSVLDDIQLHPSAYNVNPSTEAILKNLHRKISLSMTLANRYELGLGSGSRRIRKWNALKVALKSEKLNKLRDSLNDTKITLIIALQSLSQ